MPRRRGRAKAADNKTDESIKEIERKSAEKKLHAVYFPCPSSWMPSQSSRSADRRHKIKETLKRNPNYVMPWERRMLKKVWNHQKLFVLYVWADR